MPRDEETSMLKISIWDFEARKIPNEFSIILETPEETKERVSFCYFKPWIQTGCMNLYVNVWDDCPPLKTSLINPLKFVLT